eukprot:5325330-Lingulodinium_polyedra.AAC.1
MPPKLRHTVGTPVHGVSERALCRLAAHFAQVGKSQISTRRSSAGARKDQLDSCTDTLRSPLGCG